MSAEQYGRKFSLILADGAGAGLDFTDLKVTFEIRRGDYQNPNTADVRIYNLADQTANRIRDEFTQISIQAGYEGSFGLIFRGSIKQVRKGRLDGKDGYVDITAADGDEAYNFSPLSFSLAAGTKPADDVQAVLQVMARAGITKGYAPQLSANGRVRGRVFYGQARDELRDFAKTNGLLWSIQDGALTLIPADSYIPGDIPLISPSAGLVGVPEQTQNGIEIRTLLNPALRIGQLIQLDSTVNLLRAGLDRESFLQKQTLRTSLKTNADGLYYVMVANHSGDTRGNEWYTDLVCLAADATQIKQFVDQSTVFPANAIPRF
jgi:hypothetical protein